MTHLEVIEGTWEELAADAAVLKGRRLRLIVLPAAADIADSVTNEPRLRENASTVVCRGGLYRARARHTWKRYPYKAAFGGIIAEKHRKMGLKL